MLMLMLLLLLLLCFVLCGWDWFEEVAQLSMPFNGIFMDRMDVGLECLLFRIGVCVSINKCICGGG